jgi:hypothetical protein
MSEELQLLIEKLVYGGDGSHMFCQEKKFARKLPPARKS